MTQIYNVFFHHIFKSILAFVVTSISFFFFLMLCPHDGLQIYRISLETLSREDKRFTVVMPLS